MQSRRRCVIIYSSGGNLRRKEVKEMPKGNQSAQPRATYWGCILYPDNPEHEAFRKYIIEHDKTIEYWMIKHDPDLTWTCQCGNECHSQFCPKCGKPIPEEAKPKKKEKPKMPQVWRCECGCVNAEEYAYCEDCGKKKPEEQEQQITEQQKEEQRQEEAEETKANKKYHYHVMIKMKGQTARNGFVKWTGGVVTYAKPIDSPEGSILYFLHETPASREKKQYPAENIITNNRKMVDKATLGRLLIYQHLYTLSQMVTEEKMTLNDIVKEIAYRAHEQEKGAESLAETMLRYQNLVIAMAQENRSTYNKKGENKNDNQRICGNPEQGEA